MFSVLREVLKLIWVQWVYSLVVAQIVQLELVLDPDLLLLQFLLLVISGPRLPLQSFLLLLASEVDVAILSPPGQVHHAKRINQQVLLHVLIQRTVSHEARRLVYFY